MKNIIETPFGKTVLNVFGDGPPILVVHGGPGFFHNYLVDGLLPLAEKRSLIFYDQPTFENTPLPKKEFSPQTIFAHFRWLANELSQTDPLGIIAHSWGGLVVIAGLTEPTLQTKPLPNLSRVLLLNTMPLTSKELIQSRKNLMDRLSWLSKIKLVLLICTFASGQKIMKQLLPYYVYDQSCIPKDEFKFSKKTYLKILQQLKSYDFEKDLGALPELDLLLSEKDFITSSHLQSLIEIAENQFTIKKSVHFPMWENPKDFDDFIKSVFT